MAKNKTILLIDDDPDIVAVTANLLKKARYDVATAATGQEGLDAAAKVKPDLILLDLGLPDIDGSEVCRRLRADQGSKAIPIIIFTARYSAEVADQKHALPVEDYIIKPYEPRDMLAKIKKYI